MSGTSHCLLCPSENTTALTMTLSYPSTCMLVLRLQGKISKAKQILICLFLSPGIWDHQADRGACCCCNRPIVLCFGFKSYRHYTFYKQTNKQRHISRKELVNFFADYFLVYACIGHSIKLPLCAFSINSTETFFQSET